LYGKGKPVDALDDDSAENNKEKGES
jgi:hypothetical protein